MFEPNLWLMSLALATSFVIVVGIGYCIYRAIKYFINYARRRRSKGGQK